MLVRDILSRLKISCYSIQLGVAELQCKLSDFQHDELKKLLLQSGLALLEDRRSIFVERIKTIIIEVVHYQEVADDVNLSVLLTQRLHYNYTYLANLFSRTTGITIARFFIIHKIERVKELLVYNELTLTEIALKMHYSSVGHISNQFKKVTGISPSDFKKLEKDRRSVLEKLG